MNIDHIYQGDTLEVLRTIPDECVDTIITSPPYWGLRQYLFDGAVIINPNLTDEQKDYLEKELSKRNIIPKYGGKNER